MKTMWDSLKELQNADRKINSEMNEIKVLVAGQYVRREEFDRMSQAIFAKLERIEEKLDRKEDK
jgi:CHASE3 domain sensor protein